VSRQRLKAAYTWSDTRYSQFSYLDFTGYEGRATWQWEIAGETAGELGYSKSSTLASFANTQSTAPDILKTQQGFFNAVYRVSPVWRLRAGVRGLELENSDPQRQSNDIRALNSDVALSYVIEADVSVGLGARSERGHFPNPQVIGGTSFDNDYRQYGVGVVGDWTITGVSRLSARADRVRRRYIHLPQRDFEGNAGRLEYEWRPTGKLLLSGIIQRDISPYEDLRTSFAVLRGVTLRPRLSVTEKVEVSGALEYNVRDFLGDPGLVSSDLPSRTDRVRLAAVTVSYRPTRAVGLLGSVQREIRTSNVPLVDYEVSVFSVSLRITF
jgi:exopolysaccharide biosynthesis operon protein EpsL